MLSYLSNVLKINIFFLVNIVFELHLSLFIECFSIHYFYRLSELGSTHRLIVSVEYTLHFINLFSLIL